jgi:hypothetical protein
MTRIKDMVEWPPSVWGGFYSIGNNQTPDFVTSTIKSVSLIKGEINLTIVSGSKDTSVTLKVLDPSFTNRIFNVLSSSTGSILEEAIETLI